MFNPKKNRGQILVLAARAIDIGYFYHTKNQLQSATDASALAGAAALPDETTARAEAVKYALMNIAAGTAVQVSKDGSNVLSSFPLTPAMT
jgi:uncharacterized membrane protein